ncbi:MAG: DegT/DnrJ/EryC1/StrS family aminotransferase [Thalassotalea sp.]
MKEILVTRPSLPPLKEMMPYLEDIWERKWLTNKGYYHQMFEEKLSEYLNVKNISLFCNGTLALQVGLKALGIKKEVITTPFTFVATAHAIKWNGCTPVFADIDRHNYNLDASKVSSLITEHTQAILPVHVYGHPCDFKQFQTIAEKHNLKLFYDAAHAFGVKSTENSLLHYGDLSMLSFHATKIFNTIEGGALISNDINMKEEIDNLINFAIKNEESVVGIGINGKMNEIQAAYGLIQLKYADCYISKNRAIAEQYNSRLQGIPGLTLSPEHKTMSSNSSYFPVLVDQALFGISRDELYNQLMIHNIHTRKYFYPLVSEFDDYNTLKTSTKAHLPNAYKISRQILCLPIYPNLTDDEHQYICDNIIKIYVKANKN